MWKYVLILYSLMAFVKAFNIDVQRVKHFTGNAGTNFGFQIRFDTTDPSDDDMLMLVVSAPKDSSPTTAQGAGAVRYCYMALSDEESICTERKDQSLSSLDVYNTPANYANEGYGVSMSASDEAVLICAPYWKDTLHAAAGYTFMPGRCTIRFRYEQKARRDLVRYYGTENYMKEGLYYYGLADFGFSTDVSGDSVFAIGAPGLTIHEGGIYITDIASGNSSETVPPTFRNTRTDVDPPTAYGYNGYAVKFGHFCDGSICLASGAPNLQQKGRVRLYKWENKKELVELQVLEGENEWSYFGSVLCAVNVDADSYDELLIGAPMFTDVHDHSGGLDIGKVYIYKRSDASQEYELEFKLEGSRQIYSRFGSAIESIESINLDQFKDVIIGAPGEEDGKGCAYIYLGSSLGLSRKYSQRICASQLTGTTRHFQGFGSAFSSYSHGSKYPVFAVGSYLSDIVTLFQCRPIIDVDMSLKADPNPIKMPKAEDAGKEITTTVKACIKFEILNAPKEPQEFLINMEIDKEVEVETIKRAGFVDQSGTLKYHINETLRVLVGKTICLNKRTRIQKSNLFRNRFTPIEVVASYHLIEKSGSVINPVLNVIAENKKSLMLTFLNDCGPDDVCKVDLKTQGELIPSNLGKWSDIVVNHTSELTAVVKVTNTGETSYWTQIQIHVDQSFPYLHYDSVHVKQCSAYPSTVDSDEVNMLCNYYQPLAKDSTIELRMVFRIDTINLDRKTVVLNAVASPMYPKHNPEVNDDDNAAELSLPVFIVAPVTINGASSPSEIAITSAREISKSADKDVDIHMNDINWKSDSEAMIHNHKLQIKNQGPSFLPETDISLSIPVFLPDGTQLINSLSLELSVHKEKSISCFTSGRSGVETTTTIDITQIALIKKPKGAESTSGSTHITLPPSISTTMEMSTTTGFNFNGKINRRKRSASGAEKESPKTYTLSCLDEDDYCQTYNCKLPLNLAPGGHAEVNITFTVDEKNIPMPEDYSIFELKLLTVVNQPSHDLFKDWNSEEIKQAWTQTTTVFHLVKSGGKINLWIIIGSIIGGLVLIFLIAILLWKCGFFKREKHYQVENWKRESQRRSQKASSESQDCPKDGDDVNGGDDVKDGV